MHLAWRWFTGLGFDQEIPHHSTLRIDCRTDFVSRTMSPFDCPMRLRGPARRGPWLLCKSLEQSGENPTPFLGAIRFVQFQR